MLLKMKNQFPLRGRHFKDSSDVVHKPYANFILETINDHCLHMAVMEGAYPWHYHERTDELFIVLEGALKIDIQGQEPVILQPGDFIRIPAKTIHRTSALCRTVNLTFERAGDDTVFITGAEEEKPA